jgi:glycine cleavage system regulatory protein
MPSLVLTLIGRDRPGIVEAVAQPIAAHGGSWLESRMAHLAGQFAGILLVEVGEAAVAPLTAALRELEGRGLRVVVEASPQPPDVGERRALDLDLVGLDRPGIVREISHVLAAHGANIEELTTDRTAAAMSGELLFRARARVQLPAGGEAARLRSALERLAGDLMVQLTLAEPEPSSR